MTKSNEVMKLNCQKHLFNLDENLIFLNGAYMSPLLKSTESIGIHNLKIKRNPGKIEIDQFFGFSEDLKKAFGALINVKDIDGVVPVGSASYGLASVAANIDFSSGDSILLLKDQFPSNYYIWQRYAEKHSLSIKIIGPHEKLHKRGESWNVKILEAIDKNTKVVSVPHVHWADGTLFDLEKISKRCREVNAYLIIDGTQSIGALPFDQSRIKADAVICAGYKWLHGPYGIGAAYYGERFLDGVPIEESWINRLNSDNFKDLVNYQAEYRPGAQRYAVGESSNFILLSMLVDGIKQTVEWNPELFQQYCKTISESITIRLVEKGYWSEDADHRAFHLFGLKIPDHISAEKVKAELTNNHISVSYRGDYIRVSPSVYNDLSDANKFVECLMNFD